MTSPNDGMLKQRCEKQTKNWNNVCNR